MEKPYDHKEIELKWSQRWANSPVFKAEENSPRPKYYVLEMLPIPAGSSISAISATTPSANALARYKWMSGFNGLQPYGLGRVRSSGGKRGHQEQPEPREWTLAQHLGASSQEGGL